jgi:hypothetical protein
VRKTEGGGGQGGEGILWEKERQSRGSVGRRGLGVGGERYSQLCGGGGAGNAGCVSGGRLEAGDEGRVRWGL